MIEYKAVIYQEGMLGSLLLGQSKINPVRFSEFLNANAQDGWEVGMLSYYKRVKNEHYVIGKHHYGSCIGTLCTVWIDPAMDDCSLMGYLCKDQYYSCGDRYSNFRSGNTLQRVH